MMVVMMVEKLEEKKVDSRVNVMVE